MKHILFFLFISTGLLAQTPRLNLKQLTKDTTFGSVLISTPSDSGIVFSRDFYISYGADTALILYGDTVGVGATLDAEQVQDIVGAMANAGLGIDITYNDTDGELLFESLSIEDSIKNETGTLIAKGTPLYATGTQGNYWTVAPADASDPTKLPVVVIAGENIADGATGLGLIKGHIKGVNTGDFTAGDEIWLASGGGYTNIEPKGGGVYSQSLGTVIKVDATDGSGIINIQEPHQTLAPDHIFIGGADSLITSTEYIVDSTRISATGDTAYYYQNGVLIGTGAIAGGGTTYNNISETVDTVYISDYLDVDTSTLYVDATNNRVGIGTTSPLIGLQVESGGCFGSSCADVLPLGSANVRALNLIAPDAVMKIHRKTSITNAASAIELVWGPDNNRTGTNNAYWDVFVEVRSADATRTGKGDMVFRRRSLIGAGSDSDNLFTVWGTKGQIIAPGIKDTTTANSANVYVGADGMLYKYVSSSLRYKENILDWDADGLDIIKNLKPRTFTYKADYYGQPDKIMLGLIAEEVEEVSPFLVDYKKENGISEVENVRYANIVVPLIKAIQEQQAIIESQSTEIEQLKTLITELSNRLTILENN